MTVNPNDNSNYALGKLRAYIQAQDLAKDRRLPTERAFAETFNVGRRAVRRALEVLEAEGLIWRRQGAGTFVGEKPDDWSAQVTELVAGTDIMEIMEVRLRIEPQLAQLAAMRAKPAEVERMRALVHKTGQSTDADAKELWDGSLHRQIAQSAGNKLFLSIFDVINRIRQDDAWQSIRELARRSGTNGKASFEQHIAIVDAIADRDPARAGEAMRQHLLMHQERLIRATSLGFLEEKTGQDIGARSTGDADNPLTPAS
ncbi:FadR/GntR family transcriptional regulator [Agrobacterium salinitolerans]|uniref:FadR family transcriptional regulator n=1 Tax=Agrobacterium salinitolerans TaxID=1183413 RepID=A0A9X3QYH1_9HYPH|nr:MULTISPECIES: FadR/GntR family transcriptional regulator [Agrobacterium]MCZ7854208.1 FadR/GntR family transcriptional regulator [Agrobacterium salinitolerans]MCZ7887323.1 FadR/GntR family transcriptional regulator [Agrobacterium salinitolerans]MCZ7892754.1 FadR/GntR family transcriptional regulator [Agrobacterium salinitolerans]MCZ7937611.1 FadR/GntR family transcriptional regulator [Agrobacterium salinitolerans]MCZ7975938.1 FadR/GntR family transcriptional regulator [Agrobacterium salinito